MNPYFDRDGITIYHGRAEDVLPTLAASSADLIVTDPPYGIDYQSNRRPQKMDKIAGDDGSLDVKAIIGQALRCLRRGRHIYVFGSFDTDGLPLCSATSLIWDKQIMGPGDLSLPWGPSHEPITFAVYEISKANRDKGFGRFAARLRQGSVIRCQRLQSGQVALHPNEKPVRLLRQLIESSSCFDDVVLDPFMGSGSTLDAARQEGRRAIGIDVDERFCEIAAKRLGG